MLFSDHDSLRHLQCQKHLNVRHAHWVEFLQQYTFVLKHKAGTKNQVFDALSRKSLLLTTLAIEVTTFQELKTQYKLDPDFGSIYNVLCTQPHKSHDHISLTDGYLFKGTKLCLPKTSIREFVIRALRDLKMWQRQVMF